VSVSVLRFGAIILSVVSIVALGVLQTTRAKLSAQEAGTAEQRWAQVFATPRTLSARTGSSNTSSVIGASETNFARALTEQEPKADGSFQQEITAQNPTQRDQGRSKPKEERLTSARPFKGDLRSLPYRTPIKRERPEREEPEPNPITFPGRSSVQPQVDLAAPGQQITPSAPAPAPTASFDGLDFATWGAGHPPDTVGDVGPTYYIQSINSSIGIFRKSDGVRVAAFTLNTFMSQGSFGNLCDTNNFGDPVILYDTFEDRWIITDFAFQLSSGNVVNPPGAFQCIAASQTGDPVSGGWNFYSINTAYGLGDYPKFGIWPDGLYMTASIFGFPSGAPFQNARAYAFNKQQMYAGVANPQVVSFDILGGDFTILPSNARLQTGTPAPGTPNYYLSTWLYLNAVTVYKFHVDWNHISQSTFTGPDVPSAATSWPNAAVPNAPSLGGNALDVLQIRAMMQNQYTNIGGVESLWATHTVRRGNTSGFAAPRWYQVDVSGGTVNPNISQATTWDPDGANVMYRFMPSLAVDRAGDMALGYSTSSSTTKPAIMYAGRLATDPINTFSQTEQLLIQGTGTQTGTCGGSTCTRWGDYSTMSLDPNGCTFWYTNMYYAVDGLNHLTRIGSFGPFPGCTPVGAGGTLSGTVTATNGGAPIAGSTVQFGSRSTTTNGAGFYSFSIPAGTYPSVGASKPGFIAASASAVSVTDGNTTTQNFSLADAPTTGCLVDTTQIDLQGGTPAGVDLVTTPGSAVLSTGDPQNSLITTSGGSVTATTWGGQTFTPISTGQVTKIDINLFCSSCSGSPQNLTVGIRATSGGFPTGADLATATIPGFISGTQQYYTATFASPVALTGGTMYAFIIHPNVNPTGTYALTRSGADVYSGGTRLSGSSSGTVWSSPLTSTQTTDAGFRVWMGQNLTAGNLISSVKDANPSAGKTAIWGTLSWNATTPANTAINFQVAGSNSPNGPFNFVGPDGTAGTFFTTSPVSLSQFYNFRYLRYKAFLSTTDANVTPSLNDATICFNVVDCSGTTATITPTPAAVCSNSTGNTASGPAGMTSYAWGITNGTITSATNTQSVTYTAGASGNVTLNLTVNAPNGCVVSGSQPVTINPIPATPTINPSGTTSLCPSGSVTLTSSSATGNQWYLNGNPIGGANNQNYIANQIGNYTVVVTGAGCSSAPSLATTLAAGQSSITVTNTNDSGAGSLRQAIADICDGGTIDFNIPGGGPDTITLTTGELAIAKNLTIAGSTAKSLTISGNSAGRVFNISASKNFAISNLTIANGQSTAGGGIYSLGNLTITNCTFTGNSAVGSPGEGGAINTGGGTVKIINTTISGNQADGNGGGLFNSGTSQTLLTNVTIASNTSNGQNGGNIAQTSSNPITLNNTIVALGQSAGDAANDIFCAPADFFFAGSPESTINSSSSNNLIGDGTGAIGITNDNGNQIGTTEATVNPLLGALQDNGGPTFTRALGDFSPAIDTGKNSVAVDQNNNALTTDQRGTGFPRVVHVTVDIGAFEKPFTPPPASADMGVTKSANAANSLPDRDIVYSLTVINPGPDAAASVTLTDPLPGDMTFVSLSSPAGWSCTTPSVGANGTVSCTNASFAVGSSNVFTLTAHIPSSASPGTSYFNTATVSSSTNDPNPDNNNSSANTDVFACLTNPVVTTNADSGAGSLRQAIADACDGATIVFDMSQVASPISLTSGELLINKNLTITGPGANLLTVQRSTAGGTPNFRIFNVASTFTVNISGLTITNGNLNGAVIPAASEDKTEGISPSFIAVNPGGGILNSGTLVLNKVTITRNSADRAGGISNGGTLTLLNSTVSGNISVSFGGGFVNTNALTIINGTISGNSSAGQGGGVYNDGAGTLTATNATITNNRSDSDNSGAEQGGGIFRNAGTVTLKNTIVAGNFRGTGTTRDDVSGAVDASSSFNLIGDGTNMTGITNGSNGNQVGSAGSPINALLGALAANGGPTQTHLPQPASSAINAGSNANLPADTFDLNGNSDTSEPLPFDQRGLNRAVGSAVDIGAVETNYVLTVTAGSGQNTNVNSALGTALKATLTNSGNPISGIGVTFTAPNSGASGTFPGSSLTATVNTDGSGVATAPTFTANAIGGSYNVVASVGPNIPTVSFSLTNNKLNQSITFGSISGKTFGDADFVVSPTASSSLAVTLGASGNCTVSTPAPGTVHITGAGSCTITASQAGNATYNAASDLSQTFNIAKASQTITFASIAGKTFGDADFVVSPTASSSLAVTLGASGNCTVTTPAPGTVHLTGAGSCTITASQAGNSNYNAATNVPQTFSIAKAATTTALTALPNPSNNGQSVTFTATVASSAGTPTGTVQFKDGGTNLGSPQTLNGSGVATFSTSALTPGLHTITADYSGDANFNTSSGTLSGGQQVGSIIRFSSATYNTTEGAGFTTITVQRIGDLSQAVTVNYATPDDSTATTVLPCSTASGVASSRCDFETALGTLSWASGDGASKTFTVLINQDNFVEGPESLTLTLSNLTGAGVGFPTPGATTMTATLTIADDVTEPAGNPLDDTDTFVRQQYRDFLSREPDPSGLAFWKNNIDSCGANAQCREVRRIDTSAAFFLSIEFQNTGYFVERTYKAGFGDINPPTIPVPVRFTNFLTDTQQIGNGVIVGVGNWQAQLDTNKTAFAQAFVQRPAFLTRYPAALSATAFVDALDANAGNVLSFSERAALISELSPNPSNPTLRASVLRKVAENATLAQREFNRAFVLLQYFGYLRRNPDAAPEPGLNFAGYNFWLSKLNQFNGNYIDAEMVKAFLTSTEYRRRFGP